VVKAAIGVFIALLLLGSSAFAQGVGPIGPPSVGITSIPVSPAQGGTGWVLPNTLGAAILQYPAQAFGSCIWDGATGHDVGPCVNVAIAAAAANGGGTVVVPAPPNTPTGVFYFATEIVNTTSAVKITSAGTGIARDTAVPNIFLAGTRLVWNGAAGAGPAFYDGIGSGTTTIYAADVTNIVFDCGDLLNTCVHIQQVYGSTFNFGQAEAVKTGVLFDTATADSIGNQYDVITLTLRNLGASNTSTATGVVFDSGGTFNTSYDLIHSIDCAYAGGDCIVAGNSDTDAFDGPVRAYHYGSLTSGSPFVMANSAYVPPSGVAVNNRAYDFHFSGVVGAPLYLAGFINGATFTPTVGNAGTGVLNPITLTTNATTAAQSYVLNFASTTGVAAKEAANCGGTSSGVYPNTLVASVGGSTVTLNLSAVSGGGISGVANGQSCTFSLGINPLAVAGTYTITAASPTTFNITAPVGGHSQSAIAISSGVIGFTDMTVPLTGTPVTNDTYTVVVPSPSYLTQVDFVDKANSISDPGFESGATGVAPFGTQRSMVLVSNTLGALLAVWNPANTAASILPPTEAAGAVFNGVTLGANSCNNTSSLGTCLAGPGNILSGFYNLVAGANNTVSGTASSGLGEEATDRGRFSSSTFGSGDFVAQGDAQSGKFVLRGTTSSTSTVRLTGDGNAAGSANCVNIPNNSAFSVVITTQAFDHTTIANNEVWNLWGGLLTRGGNAAATAWTASSLPTPLTNGTVTGSTLAASADTTNGCLNITFTPPSGNSDKWNVVAHVETVEVQ
jgi:hypothetical protein